MNHRISVGCIIDRLKHDRLFVEARHICEETMIEAIHYDSRKVGENTLFICKGASFKRDYIDAAQKKGAIIFMMDQAYDEGLTIPTLVVTNIRQAMAAVCDAFYESPWKHLVMIGVTGTKGKSTTVTMLKAIFDEWASRQGYRPCGVTSSTRIFDGVVDEAAKLTTPETRDLYHHLATAVDAGLTHMIVEVSSQALKYGRVSGIRFNHAIFLNIAPDHIGPIEHPNFEDYFQSKQKIFDVCNVAHINMDSDHFEQIIEFAKMHCQVRTFSRMQPADCWAHSCKHEADGLYFVVSGEDFSQPVHLPMHGQFNIDNALSGISVAVACGIDFSSITCALAKTNMPGHMEYLYGKDVTVIVDYAHNDISFRQVFSTVMEDYPKAKRYVVFGAPGNKAESRRADLGKVASEFADEIYLTTDDSAFELLSDINAEIRAAFVSDKPCHEIEQRKDAIEAAVAQAESGSLILILGKGNEHTQKILGEDRFWPGDVEIAVQALKIRDARE